jgi:hypothetical protein
MTFVRPVQIPLLIAALMPSVASECRAQNLFENPGFESGNTGFRSDYSFSSGGNCCEGQYTVRSNGSTFNGAFVNPPAASPGSVQMMVINGSTVPNLRVWWQRVAVTPGRTYDLSMSGCTAVAGGPAVLQWQIGGVLLATPVSLPSVTREWVRIPGSWTAPPGVTEVEVAVRNLNTSTFPNDFYLDDMLMRERTCPADFNGDGFLDFFDYGDFVACFEGTCSPGLTADFNGDGFVDFFDYDDFVGAFEAGC